MPSRIKSQGLKKNLAFQIAYQAIVLIIPLIVSPYLTRTLGKTQLGIYTYTYTIAYYFVILANLGLLKYGQRAIAESKNDETKLRKVFWSLFSINVVSSLTSLGFYSIFVIFLGQNYNDVYWIQLLYVASALFDSTFLFNGLENFKSVTLRNLIIKVAETVLIFIFVKSDADVLKYTLIISVSLFVSKFSFLPEVIYLVKPIKLSWSDVSPHIKPTLAFFTAQIAITLYTLIDKTLLGLMTNEDNVALYEYSDKIVNVPKCFVGAISGVIYPRVCTCVANNELEKINKYERYYYNAVYFIGFATIFGLLGVGNLFAFLYYGEEFAECGNYMIALSPVVLIIALGDIPRHLFILPYHKDKEYMISLFASAAANIVFSAILIPYLGVFGAIIGTLIAEVAFMVSCIVIGRKHLDMKQMVLTSIPYAIIGAIMFGVIYLLRMFFNDSIAHLIMQIAVGAVIYCALSGIYLLCISPIKGEIRQSVKSRFSKKKAAAPDNDKESNDEKNE